MKTYLFVAEDGEAAQRLIREMGQRKIVVTLIAGDDAEGSRLRETYDITTRPAALVTQEDGTYVRLWQGRLPDVAELAYAVQGR